MTIDVARAYLARGWAPIPVPHREKAPCLEGWQRLRLAEADLAQFFNGHAQNIGVLLGSPSGGLVDVDLDCPEALALADTFLPPTGAAFGRRSKPRAHRLYRVDSALRTQRFLDPARVGDVAEDRERAVLVELRAEGAQTIFPPSTHPSGEVVMWDAAGEPAEVSAATLERAVRRLAAAALLARHWPAPGSRHDTALALAGALARAGWSDDEAEQFIAAVADAAGDEETRDRVKTVATTARRLGEGRTATGLQRLRELLDPRVVERVTTWLELRARAAVDAGDSAPGAALPYRGTPTGLVWDKPTAHGAVPVPLTNFTARIIADVARDDGSGEITRAFELEAELRGRRRRFSVSAEKFASMTWPVEHLGAGAIVYPGQAAKEHARVAIQLLSGDVLERVVYTHTGWRQLADGSLVYLHAGGALGADGPVADVAVDLPGVLSPFRLPDPPMGEDRQAVVRAELALLDLAPDRVTVPLLAAVYRAVLNLAAPADFSLHLTGPTGVGKTELAALAQAHCGAGFDGRHLPAAWASTANALEVLAFLAKDAVLVVDDFAPGGDLRDVARLHREADRLLRAQGNRAGRGRLRSDASLRPARPPRGVIVSTGEDVPRGESLRARVLVLDLAPGDLDWQQLTAAQAAASAGAYAQALAAFVQHVAKTADAARAQFLAERERWRAWALQRLSAAHKRTATIVADLAATWEALIAAWRRWGAIDAAQAQALRDRIKRALLAAASTQRAHVDAADPVRQFLQLLAGALVAGRAHLAAPGGGEPDDPERWGWRRVPGPDDAPAAYRPLGERVGWIDADGSLLLDPAASFAVVQRLARDGGEALPVTARTLHKRLAQAGLVASREAARETVLVRRTISGVRRTVLHLRAEALDAEKPDQPDQPDQPDPPPSPGGTGRRGFGANWSGWGGEQGENLTTTPAHCRGEPCSAVGVPAPDRNGGAGWSGSGQVPWSGSADGADQNLTRTPGDVTLSGRPSPSPDGAGGGVGARSGQAGQVGQVFPTQERAGGSCDAPGCDRRLERYTPHGVGLCLVHAVLVAAERRTWPRHIAAGVRIIQGPEGWRAFVQTATEEALRAALAALEGG